MDGGIPGEKISCGEREDQDGNGKLFQWGRIRKEGVVSKLLCL